MRSRGTEQLTEIQTEQIAAHAIVEACIVQDKLPLNFWRDFGRAAQRLQRLVA